MRDSVTIQSNSSIESYLRLIYLTKEQQEIYEWWSFKNPAFLKENCFIYSPQDLNDENCLHEQDVIITCYKNFDDEQEKNKKKKLTRRETSETETETSLLSLNRTFSDLLIEDHMLPRKSGK